MKVIIEQVSKPQVFFSPEFLDCYTDILKELLLLDWETYFEEVLKYNLEEAKKLLFTVVFFSFNAKALRVKCNSFLF